MDYNLNLKSRKICNLTKFCPCKVVLEKAIAINKSIELLSHWKPMSNTHLNTIDNKLIYD